MTSVAIIGAGFGGLGVALRLQRAGFTDVTVYERAAAVGGTWQANTYPGAACDAPSHIYSWSFAPNRSWSRRFAPGAEIRDYIERCVDDAGLRGRIRTHCTVTSAAWNGTRWDLSFADGTAASADVLVPACGQLSEPALPHLPGLDSFAGPAFHTGRWRHDVELTGLRVGVVGTGASAVQVVPAIVERTAHLTMFQRSAPYVFAKADTAYSRRLHLLYDRLPLAQALARRGIAGMLEVVSVGFWAAPALLRSMEFFHRRYLASVVADPQLRAKLTPRDRAGCKRILMDSEYYPALARADVTVEDRGISRVEPAGVRLADGTLIELDALVLGTGFRHTAFLSGVEVYGRDGVALRDVWSERALAYLGISVPSFPNMFLLYGPNTNLGSGSIIAMLEAQAEHVVDAVRLLHESPQPLEVTEPALHRYATWLDARLPRTVWATGCTSWYQDAQGRNTHNWPSSTLTYRRRTARVSLADYRRLPEPAGGRDLTPPPNLARA